MNQGRAIRRCNLAVFVAFPCVLLSLHVCGCIREAKNRHDDGQAREIIALLHRGNALSALTVLQHLREGRTDHALEILEHEVDTAVCHAWQRAQRLEPAAKKQELEFLAKVKEYRGRYPRKREADIDYAPFEKLSSQTREQAKAILSENVFEPLDEG